MSPRVRELRVTYHPHPSGAVADRAAITPAQTAAILIPMLENQAQEVALVLLLTAKYRVLGVHEVGRGGLMGVEMSPQIIYRAALLANAAAIIIAHNHPSGDPTPSPEDRTATAQIKAAGKVLGIDCIDHVIIGDRKYYSFKEMGLL